MQTPPTNQWTHSHTFTNGQLPDADDAQRAKRSSNNYRCLWLFLVLLTENFDSKTVLLSAKWSAYVWNYCINLKIPVAIVYSKAAVKCSAQVYTATKAPRSCDAERLFIVFSIFVPPACWLLLGSGYSLGLEHANIVELVERQSISGSECRGLAQLSGEKARILKNTSHAHIPLKKEFRGQLRRQEQPYEIPCGEITLKGGWNISCGELIIL